jgi:hypothetical protein
VADLEYLIAAQPAADLLRAQVGPEELFDGLPVLGSKAAVPPRARSAAVGLFLRSRRPVRSVIGCAVALHLAADRARMALHEPGDCRVGELWLLFPQRGERIPLLAGDLLVTHDDPFLAEDSSVSQIARVFS